MSNHCTMQGIADHLGVSRMTVSTVINGKGVRLVAPETEQRIQRYLQKVGYVPNRSALNLQQGNRGTFGLLHCGDLYSHLIDALNMMTNRFVQTPQSVEIVTVKSGQLAGGFRELKARSVAKLVWLGAGSPRQLHQQIDEALPLLSSITTVLHNYPFEDGKWDQRFADQGIHLVGVDRRAAFRHLGRLLVEHGHRRVAMPGVKADDPHFQTDANASGLRDVGLEVVGTYPKNRTYSIPFNVAGKLAPSLMAAMRKQGVTAACFIDDRTAAATMFHMMRRGVRVPHDLSVTGMDGQPWAAYLPVPLTTLAMPTEAMVDHIETIFSQPAQEFIHPFPMQLVARQSHGPAPAKPRVRRRPPQAIMKGN